MITRLHITVLIILTVIIWAGTLLLLGLPLTWEYLKPYGITVGVTTAVATAFDRWMWHWPVFRNWLVKRPYLQGTWETTLVSDYIDPKTKKPVPPIPAIVTVRQTLTAMSLRLFTRESNSFLAGNKIVQQNDGIFELIGVYQNEPRIDLRGLRSEIHFGALKLNINGIPPSSLSGHYWTDRNTKGGMHLVRRIPALAESFDHGQNLLEAQQSI
jgi:hypothetical protein